MLHVLLPTNQTCLATNKIIAGCEKLLQKVVLPFATKSANLICNMSNVTHVYGANDA